MGPAGPAFIKHQMERCHLQGDLSEADMQLLLQEVHDNAIILIGEQKAADLKDQLKALITQ